MAKKDMKRIFVIDSNLEGGHPTYCESLCGVLVRSGFDVVFLRFSDVREVMANRTDVIFDGRTLFGKWNIKILTYLRMAIYILKNCNRKDSVFLQVANFYAIFFVLPAIVKTRHRYLTLHNIFPHSNRSLDKISSFAIKIFVKLKFFEKVVIHESAAELIKQDWNSSESLIHDGIVTLIPHHHFRETPFNTFYRKPSPPRIKLLLFGVVRKNKGYLEFISKIVQSGLAHRVEVTIAGNFVDLKPDIFLKYATLDGLKITAIDRFVSDNEKMALFRDSDFAVLPYLDSFSAQSGVVLDAYYFETPLIVSNNRRLSAMIRRDKTGIILDDVDFKKTFNEDVLDFNYHIELVKNIRRCNREIYNWDSISRIYKSEFIECAGK